VNTLTTNSTGAELIERLKNAARINIEFGNALCLLTLEANLERVFFEAEDRPQLCRTSFLTSFPSTHTPERNVKSTHAAMAASMDAYLLRRSIYGKTDIPPLLWTTHLKARSLDSHSGCVNTLAYSTTGDLLLSGSDDTTLCSHSVNNAYTLVNSIQTLHTANIFCGKYLTDERYVSCDKRGAICITNVERCRAINPAMSLIELEAPPDSLQFRCHKDMAFELCPASESCFYSCSNVCRDLSRLTPLNRIPPLDSLIYVVSPPVHVYANTRVKQTFCFKRATTSASLQSTWVCETRVFIL
jgi:WD40 repeat protein